MELRRQRKLSLKNLRDPQAPGRGTRSGADDLPAFDIFQLRNGRAKGSHWRSLGARKCTEQARNHEGTTHWEVRAATAAFATAEHRPAPDACARGSRVTYPRGNDPRASSCCGRSPRTLRIHCCVDAGDPSLRSRRWGCCRRDDPFMHTFIRRATGHPRPGALAVSTAPASHSLVTSADDPPPDMYYRPSHRSVGSCVTTRPS